VTDGRRGSASSARRPTSGCSPKVSQPGRVADADLLALVDDAHLLESDVRGDPADTPSGE
jgi:hypothetical protein